MKSHPETGFSATAAPPKYFIKHAIGLNCPLPIQQAEYGCISVSFKSPFFRFGPKSVQEVKSHHTTRVSLTVASPKHLIEHVIGQNCPSHIGQGEYGCMSVSFKSPSVRLGPKCARM